MSSQILIKCDWMKETAAKHNNGMFETELHNLLELAYWVVKETIKLQKKCC